MFRVGQKVVCVDDSGYRKIIHKGDVYTVIGLAPGGFIDMIEIDCEPDALGNSGFYSRRFRPVQERKTDISVFTAMLKTKKSRINA